MRRGCVTWRWRGADELHRVPLAGFWSLGVMDAEPCSPFDRDRAGLNLGEGAGIVVLESGGHAARRGKKAEFEVAGYGAACDAHHLTAPHPEGRGLERAIRGALGAAGVAPGQIAFINAHGTATLDNDRVEAGVLARCWRGRRFCGQKGIRATSWARRAGWRRSSRCWAWARDGCRRARGL